MTPVQLMNQALNKYKILVESGSWNRPDETRERVFALEAKINNFNTKKAAFASKSKPKVYDTKRKATEKYGDKAAKRQKANKDRYAWKKVPPKESESKVKSVNGKTYHWCTTHKAWTIHSPSKCNGVSYQQGGNNKLQANNHTSY